jgi:death-on-curing protein
LLKGLNNSLLFLSKQEVLDIHAKAIAQFGGSPGLRDEGSLESALIAAEQRYFYENADLATCAATYAFHLSQAHAFVDGNKRVAAAVSEIYLEINGARLALTNDRIVDLFLRIAAGELSRNQVDQIFTQSVVL